MFSKTFQITTKKSNAYKSQKLGQRGLHALDHMRGNLSVLPFCIILMNSVIGGSISMMASLNIVSASPCRRGFTTISCGKQFETMTKFYNQCRESGSDRRSMKIRGCSTGHKINQNDYFLNQFQKEENIRGWWVIFDLLKT